MPSLSRRSPRGRPCRCPKVLENGMFSVTFEGCGPYLPTHAHAHTRPTRTHTRRAHKPSDTEAHVPRTPHALDWDGAHQESEACKLRRNGSARSGQTNKQTNKQTDRSVGLGITAQPNGRCRPDEAAAAANKQTSKQTNKQTNKQAIKPLAENGRRTRTSNPTEAASRRCAA